MKSRAMTVVSFVLHIFPYLLAAGLSVWIPFHMHFDRQDALPPEKLAAVAPVWSGLDDSSRVVIIFAVILVCFSQGLQFYLRRKCRGAKIASN